MSSKAEILQRIADAGIVRSEPLARVPREVITPQRDLIVDQFAEYAAEYRANVHRGAAGISAILTTILPSGRVVVPTDLPALWIPSTVESVPDSALDHRQLAAMDAVLTGCAIAIAETGTIVLDAGFAQGRRAITLVPDHHICVVFEDQVVWSVNEAVSALGPAVREGRPLTWISGPSATSDIELSRVEGVHGPRRLDVILVPR